MSELKRSAGIAPWLTAGALGAIAVVLAVVILVPLEHARNAPIAGLTSRQQSAMTAASQEVVNLLSYRRTAFEADFQRALDGATGTLRSDQEKLKAKAKQALDKNKVDLTGKVSEVAFAGSDNAGNVLVLVSASGYQVPASGTPVLTTLARFQMTMNRVGNKWLASDLQKVDFS